MVGVGKSEDHTNQTVGHNAYASKDGKGKSIQNIYKIS